MKKGLLIAIIFLLGGCSTKFTYNNLDWLIHWYIDDYVSLSSRQEERFDEYFSSWQDWHRNEELSRYIDHLRALKSDLQSETLVAAQIESHLNNSRQHWERLRDHISPALVDLAEELEDEQIEELFEELNEQNEEVLEELTEFNEKSEKEQTEARLEDIEEGVSEFVGRLNDNQKAIIKRYSGDFSSTRALWITYRQEFQQAARNMLATRKDNPQFREEFLALLTHPDKFRSNAYVTLREQNTKTYSRMAEELFYQLTDKQKHKLISKIDDMIADFEYLKSND